MVGSSGVDGSFRFFASFVYCNCYIDRQKLWHDIQQHHCTSPWVVLGDFNAIRFSCEKVGGAASWPPYVNEFSDFINQLELEDLRYLGQQTRLTSFCNYQLKHGLKCSAVLMPIFLLVEYLIILQQWFFLPILPNLLSNLSNSSIF